MFGRLPRGVQHMASCKNRCARAASSAACRSSSSWYADDGFALGGFFFFAGLALGGDDVSVIELAWLELHG
jgi:hypothetical protein